MLVTPLSRRQFKDGKLVDDLVSWADAVRKVAAETGAPLIDLNAASAAAAQALGPLKAADSAEGPPSPELAKALAGGTTAWGQVLRTADPAARPPCRWIHQARRPPTRRSSSYTSPGPGGRAAACSKIIAQDLAKAAPALARNLAP